MAEGMSQGEVQGVQRHDTKDADREICLFFGNGYVDYVH